MQAQGHKEIREAVIIAGLVAITQGLVSWGLETAKSHHAARKARKAAEAIKLAIEPEPEDEPDEAPRKARIYPAKEKEVENDK